MYSSVDVHNYLQGLDIPHEIFKISEHAGSLEHAVEAEGVELYKLAKVELFIVDGKPILVIVAGDKKVDTAKLKSVAGGQKVESVPPEEVTTFTGYLANHTPPVGLKTEMDAYIDYYALREDVIYTSSGDPTAILKIRSYDLVRATRGETVDVASSSEDPG